MSTWLDLLDRANHTGTDAVPSDVTSDGTTSAAGEIPVYTDTGQKEIGRSNILLSTSSPTVGTRTLSGNALLAGGHMGSGGTIEATDAGAMALGYVVESDGSAKITSDGVGALTFGNSTCTHASGTAVLAATEFGVGALVHGLCLQTASNDAAITSDASGSIVGGDCDTSGTIEAGFQAYGAIVHGFANTSGVLRAEASAAGATAIGKAIASATIIADADGAHARGNAAASGDIIADGPGARAEGHSVATSSVIQATGAGSYAGGHITIASGTIKATNKGAFAHGDVETVAANILANGAGAFAGGFALANDITSSSTGSFAYGGSGSGAISATANNAVQFGVGINGQADSLQVGDTTDGIRLTAGGSAPTVSIHDGDIWVDTTKVRVRDAGASTNMVSRLSKSITVEDPTVSENISMFFTTVAITVTQITAVITGSTSVTFDIEHGTSRATPTGTGIIGTDEVADSTTGGNITTSFDDATIPVDSFVWLSTSGLSGTPTSLNVTVEYTED
jgi:hypothetical protein